MDDVAGLKIRTMENQVHIAFWKAMGADATPMSWGEAYTALQQGVIDAGENSERVYTDFKHYEVAKYYSYTKHIVHPDVVIASTNFLDSMSAADKEIFDKLVADSTDYEFDAFAESVQEAKKDAEANGAIFVYPDTELFREKCQPLLDSISGQSEVTKKIYDKVQALREEK